MNINITTDLNDLMRKVLQIYEKHYKLQGHENTGALIKEAEIAVSVFQDKAVVDLLLNYYFEYLERGLPAEKVPFSPGSGAAHSKLIEGLKKYFKQKGNSDSEALKRAFQTAKSWKKYGRPSPGSYRFSRNGKRLGALEDTLKEVDTILNEALDTIGNKYLFALQQQLFKDWPK